MKKLLLLLCLLISANIIFAQSITLRLPEVDVTGKVNLDKIYIDIFIDNISASPLDTIVGFQLAFNTPLGSALPADRTLTWDGTITVPMNGVTYLNPLFGLTVPANAMNFPAPSVSNPIAQFIWLWGDGSSYAVLGAETFPVKIATLQFTYHTGPTIPLTGALQWSAPGKGIDKDGWMVKATSDVYYDINWYLSFPEQHYTSGSLFVAPSGKTWTGTVSGGDGIHWDADHPLNWTPPGVPGPTDDVTIPAGSAKAVIQLSGVAVVAALNIGAGVQVDLMNAGVFGPGRLTTNGPLNNSGKLRILSTGGVAGGQSGSYIDNAGIVAGGAATFDFYRDLKCTGAAYEPNGSWHYLSSPLPTGNVNQTDMYDYFVNRWNEPTSKWVQITGGSVPPCTPVGINLFGLSALSLNWDQNYSCGAINPGTGQTIEMEGLPGVAFNNFATPAFVANLTYTLGNVPDYKGWNMFGNPYPCAIDPSTVAWGGINTVGPVSGVAMYNGCGDNYIYTNPTIGWVPIAPTQGFFVEALGPGATFTFGPANRTNAAAVYQKDEITNLLTLQASGNDKSDLLYVRFMDESTPEFDATADFHKMISTAEGLPQIYTKVGEEMLAINALPDTKTVPMGFTSVTSGTYTIEAIETSEFANVVLEDLASGIETDLLNGSYTFEYTTGAEHGFVIHFTPLGTPELNANSINIWAADHNIYVQAPATTGDIVVYNLMGQEVLRTDIEAGLNVIPMTDVNTYYIVKVIGSDITETGKVFIK